MAHKSSSDRHSGALCMDCAQTTDGTQKADGVQKSLNEKAILTPSDQRCRTFRYKFGGMAIAAAALIISGIVLRPQAASALPSYARQTGQPCATCHTAFPELTPFGRAFKLNGYTAGGGLPFLKAPPIAVMIQGPQFEHYTKDWSAPPTNDTHTNNNVVLNQASLFYGGKIYGNLGAFIQGTYDGVAGTWGWDNTDIRYAQPAKLFGTDVIWGIDVNNNPTVQDPWNTTPAWGFPYIGSNPGPEFAGGGPPATMLEGGFAQTVVGTGMYTWWNDMVYAELTGYVSPPNSALDALGAGTGNTLIDGVAPYWRLAFAPTFGEHSFMIGTFGMLANEVPGGVYGIGIDQMLDIGVDAQYQFIHGRHAFEAKIRNITEFAKYNSSFFQGATSNLNDTLDTLQFTLDYVYNNTYSLTASYNHVGGTADALYGANAVTGNPLSPASDYLTFDVAYMPFSHGAPGPYPWFNARLGVTYTKYLKLLGGTTNFDGAGNNASDSDTVMAYAWLMF